jgi:hypothetical protein
MFAQGRKQHLLSFEDEEADQPSHTTTAAADPAATAAAGAAHSSSAVQQQGGGISQATAAKFKAEAKQAAAAQFKFLPTGHLADGAQKQVDQQQSRLGIVDDGAALKQQAPAGLSQIHFGMAQVGPQTPPPTGCPACCCTRRK